MSSDKLDSRQHLSIVTTFKKNLSSVIERSIKFDCRWWGGGGVYFGVKRIGMTVGNPRKLP